MYIGVKFSIMKPDKIRILKDLKRSLSLTLEDNLKEVVLFVSLPIQVPCFFDLNGLHKPGENGLDLILINPNLLKHFIDLFWPV